MEKEEFEKLKSQLHLLSQSQLKQARTIVESKLESFGPENVEEARRFYEFLKHEAENFGKRLPPFNVLDRKGIKKNFCGSFDIVENFVNKHFKVSTHAERKQAYQICARMIIYEIDQKRLATKPQNVVMLLPYIGEIVDRAFPSYAKAGLLPMLLRRR